MGPLSYAAPTILPITEQRRTVAILLLAGLLLTFIFTTSCFNLDTSSPYYGAGPGNSLFGFSLSQHFQGDKPSLLVGAPLAESGQQGTRQAGALFSCPLEFSAGGSAHNLQCTRLQVEYPTQAEHLVKPGKLNNKVLHPEGKDRQLLGFTLHSSRDGAAIVCAPLLRYSTSAYTDGVCYLLSNNLNQTGVISTCGPLPKKDRHNDYGSCEQGFSAFIDGEVILTGLPGARKWTGGVFGRYEFNSDGFPDTVERWTMEVGKEQGGVINLLAAHDYLGFSIRRGRFGFWYEEADGSNFTIVSGATRYNQTGAVVFLPFKRKSLPEEERLLGLNSDIILTGRQLGSGFGYAIEVLDLNADGFDDLIVSAPFEFTIDGDEREEYGGAIYIYFSAGVHQKRDSNDKVFRQPIVIRGNQRGRSQFGYALTQLGNVDNDAHGYEDFAVGAPEADEGQGIVYIYHGGEHGKLSTMPAQEIHAEQLLAATSSQSWLGQGKKIKNLGNALSGGVDLDGNGYADLAIGAAGSDRVVLLRARPIVGVQLGSDASGKFVIIDEKRDCPAKSRACFELTTSLEVLERNNTRNLLNFLGEPFICSLQIVPFSKNVPVRALFIDTKSHSISWPCGKEVISRTQYRKHKIYITNKNQDWTTPLKFNFTVVMRERRSSHELAPIIDKRQAEKIFTVAFDKRCGEDNDCNTDLVLKASILNMTKNEEKSYTAKVTEKDSIAIRLNVENRRERAYLARLFIRYNSNELDFPRLLTGNSDAKVVDIERNEGDYTIVSLGNPVEAKKNLLFDLIFKLVRSSSERVSTSLNFYAVVNSSSIEDVPADNEWKTEVQLIKEADLVLKAVSIPQIVRFSGGSETVTDEEDIGPEVVHSYTLTNNGPFYARNISVIIEWPLRLATNENRWLLYPLEPPLIKHNDEIRVCKSVPGIKAINPAEIFNDETLKLTYKARMFPLRRRKERSVGEQLDEEYSDDEIEIEKEQEGNQRSTHWTGWTLFTGTGISAEVVKDDVSGEEARIINLECGTGRTHCVSFTCHFNYFGNDDSALIEIRSRLWNDTLRGDYRSIEYVKLSSSGTIHVDPAQGIIESSYADNSAMATTHAYPDRPYQEEKLSLWMILLAILIGLLILSLFICLCWRCGFFKRKRPAPYLHQAQYHYERAQYSET